MLRAQELITERPAYVMRAADGTLLEVFEWRSAQAVEQAHGNAAVQRLWEEFGAACDYVSLTALAEARHPFAEFEALSL